LTQAEYTVGFDSKVDKCVTNNNNNQNNMSHIIDTLQNKADSIQSTVLESQKESVTQQLDKIQDDYNNLMQIVISSGNLKALNKSQIASRLVSLEAELISCLNFDQELTEVDSQIIEAKTSIDTKTLSIFRAIESIEDYLNRTISQFQAFDEERIESDSLISEQISQHYKAELGSKSYQTISNRIATVHKKETAIAKLTAKIKLLEAEKQEILARGPVVVEMYTELGDVLNQEFASELDKLNALQEKIRRQKEQDRLAQYNNLKTDSLYSFRKELQFLKYATPVLLAIIVYSYIDRVLDCNCKTPIITEDDKRVDNRRIWNEFKHSNQPTRNVHIKALNQEGFSVNIPFEPASHIPLQQIARDVSQVGKHIKKRVELEQALIKRGILKPSDMQEVNVYTEDSKTFILQLPNGQTVSQDSRVEILVDDHFPGAKNIQLHQVSVDDGADVDMQIISTPFIKK